MLMNIQEIEILPVKPHKGLVAFASFILDGSIYLSSIGIVTRPQGGYRLVYPTKNVGIRAFAIFHPISRDAGSLIEEAVLNKLKDVMKDTNDRYSCPTTSEG